MDPDLKQIIHDLTSQIATMNVFHALRLARDKYKEKMDDVHVSAEVDAMSDEEFLEARKLAVGGKITNAAMLLLGDEKYDYLMQSMPDQTTLFTQEVRQFDPWVLRELLNNCIAHSDYSIGGRIYVNEFEDKLILTNPGSFIPENVEVHLKTQLYFAILPEPASCRCYGSF